MRGAELARPHGTPVLGVNLGHVGFLAEAEREDLERTVGVVVERSYVVERMTLDVEVRANGALVTRTWALNEASVEKAARERMLEIMLDVDGRPLSRWGCDGVVCATPTGSTAYAFSAGGPVVWPEVEAILVVPLSAHAVRQADGGRAVVPAGHRAGTGVRRARGAVVRRPPDHRAAAGSPDRRTTR